VVALSVDTDAAVASMALQLDFSTLFSEQSLDRLRRVLPGRSDARRPPSRVAIRRLPDFARSMGALLSAGMPLVPALDASARALPESLGGVVGSVRVDVARGRPLAEALGRHPNVFPPVFVGTVHAGERAGSLSAAFSRLASHLEAERQLASKLVSMSIYPALLALVGMMAVGMLAFFVLPRFADLLEGSGAPLPPLTAAVLGTGTALRSHSLVLLVGIAGLAGLAAWLGTTSEGRLHVARLAIATPVVGNWRRQVLAARFARLLGMLTAGGSTVYSGLGDVQASMADPLAWTTVGQIRTRVREGGSLSEALREQQLFPPFLAQLVAVGEQSGRVSEFLVNAAEILERNTQRALERLVAVSEPAMIVAFGGMVALIALALLQAIYGVNAGYVP